MSVVYPVEGGLFKSQEGLKFTKFFVLVLWRCTSQYLNTLDKKFVPNYKETGAFSQAAL